MKFQVGDKVLVLHSEDEGEVVDIINEKMVMVNVRGVNFPAYIDQLDFPYFKRFMDQKKTAAPSKPAKKYIEEVPKEKNILKDKTETGVWLSIVPVMDTDEFGDDVVDTLKIHLVNRSAKGYRFEYTLDYLRGDGFELKNEVSPFQDFYIHDIAFETVNDGPSFHFVFFLKQPEKGKAEFFETSVRLKPKQLFTRIEETRQKGEAVITYPLFEKFPDKVVEEKSGIDISALVNKGYKVYAASSARQHMEPPKYEVDLHLEKLTKDGSKLSNFEKLALQLQTLEKYLDLAVAHHLRSMIVIHGVGTGKLRDEVHEILRTRRDIKSFVNRYHPAYGYGATEVFFQYSGGDKVKK